MKTTFLSRSGRTSASSGYVVNQGDINAAAERRRAALATFKSQVGQNSNKSQQVTPSATPTPGSKTQRYVGRPRAMSMLDLTLNMRASSKNIEKIDI